MPLDQTNAAFQTTHWSLLGVIRAANSTARDAALERVIACYWPAVYASVRRTGRDREQAAEIVQAFFADVVLGRRLFDQARPGRGRLRTLLLTALKRFMVDLHRRQVVRNSTVAVSLSEIEHEEQILATLAGHDPDSAFERRWAMTVLDQALTRTEQHFRSTGRDRNWEAFRARIVGPALGNCPPIPMAELARQLGFATPGDVAAAVQAVKKRATLHLREVAAETADEPDDQEDEFNRVMTLLSP